MLFRSAGATYSSVKSKDDKSGKKGTQAQQFVESLWHLKKGLIRMLRSPVLHERRTSLRLSQEIVRSYIRRE